MAVVLIRVKSYDSRVWSYDSRIGVVLNEVKSCCIVWISYDGRMSVVFSRMKVVWGSYEGRVWSYEGRVSLRNLHKPQGRARINTIFQLFLNRVRNFLNRVCEIGALVWHVVDHTEESGGQGETPPPHTHTP